MALFSDSLYAGLDIMLPLRSHTPVILEINAFGDLLPGISEGGMGKIPNLRAYRLLKKYGL